MISSSSTSSAHVRTEAARPVRRDRWLIAAVPVLLIVVAVTQMVAATTTTLTAWRGGGFGMFSTVDVHDLRAMTIQVEFVGGEVLPVDIHSFRGDRRVGEADVTARAWPSDRHLERLTSHLFETAAVLDEGVVRSQAMASVEGLPTVDWGDAATVVLAVSRIGFDRKTGRVTFPELASVTVQR